MKKFLLLSAIGVLTLSSFATPPKMTTYNMYCDGVYTGQMTCECDQARANFILISWCYNR